MKKFVIFKTNYHCEIVELEGEIDLFLNKFVISADNPAYLTSKVFNQKEFHIELCCDSLEAAQLKLLSLSLKEVENAALQLRYAESDAWRANHYLEKVKAYIGI